MKYIIIPKKETNKALFVNKNEFVHVAFNLNGGTGIKLLNFSATKKQPLIIAIPTYILVTINTNNEKNILRLSVIPKNISKTI